MHEDDVILCGSVEDWAFVGDVPGPMAHGDIRRVRQACH